MFHVKHSIMILFSWIIHRYCFEISLLLSNIVLDYSIELSSTNPVGRNDGSDLFPDPSSLGPSY